MDERVIGYKRLKRAFHDLIAPRDGKRPRHGCIPAKNLTAGRIPELDGIRGCAILLVLIWHYLANQLPNPAVLPTIVQRALGLTCSGVDLFFVLSGFLLAGILIDNRDSQSYFKVFYLRRVCRILPVYFVFLVVFLLLSVPTAHRIPTFNWLFASPMPIWSYFTFTQNVFMGLAGNFGNGGLAVTWSLAIEEQFYLLLPVLIYVTPRKSLVPVLVGFITAALALRFVSYGFFAYVNTPWRADTLLTGSLLACGVRSQRFMTFAACNRRIIVGVVLGLSAGLLLTDPFDPLLGPFVFFLTALFYAGLILLASLYDVSLLRNRALVGLGIISYGVYLFHQTVSGLVHGLTGKPVPVMASGTDVVATLLALVLTVVLATLSYYFLEKPIIDYGHRFRYQTTAS